MATGAWLTAAMVGFGFVPGFAPGFAPGFVPGFALAQSVDCGDPAGFCAVAISPDCLSRFGAGVVETGDVCAAGFAAYRDCLADVAAQCGAQTSSGPAGRCDNPKAAFDYAKTTGDAAAFRDVAELCGGTFWGRQAAREAERLEPGAGGAAAAGDADSVSTAAAAPEATLESDRGIAREAQSHLNALGYGVGSADGVWGPRSAQGLAAFQRSAGLPADGALTQAALNALRAAPKPRTPPRSVSASTQSSGACARILTPEFILANTRRFHDGSEVFVAPNGGRAFERFSNKSAQIAREGLLVALDLNDFRAGVEGVLLTPQGVYYKPAGDPLIPLGRWSQFCSTEMYFANNTAHLFGKQVREQDADIVVTVLKALQDAANRR
ncbi:MAG: peptidoglycan-binding domain-containing protein [Pseudomonadota bacterium]